MLPKRCPSCGNHLHVQSLKCESCMTIVSGEYELPVLARLDPKEEEFVLEFMKASGSLKVMAQKLKLSYPTVRNMLDDLINKLIELDKEGKK